MTSEPHEAESSRLSLTPSPPPIAPPPIANSAMPGPWRRAWLMLNVTLILAVLAVGLLTFWQFLTWRSVKSGSDPWASLGLLISVIADVILALVLTYLLIARRGMRRRAIYGVTTLLIGSLGIGVFIALATLINLINALRGRVNTDQSFTTILVNASPGLVSAAWFLTLAVLAFRLFADQLNNSRS